MSLDVLSQARGRILVIDDEADILVALQDLFEDDYDVFATTSPTEALSVLAADSSISVIVSDQRMPVMTGDVFLAEARTVTDAEAIMLTGYADLKAVVGAVNSSRIAGYMAKPWDPTALRAMVRSAYERRQLARELDVERALLRGLLENSEDAISFKDKAGRFLRLNERKARGLGQPVSACLGRTEAELLPGSGSAEAEASDQEAVDARRPVEHGRETQDENGMTRWAGVTRVPILNNRGAVEHLGIIERDITEQKRLEERLRQADKMQALGTLAGGVAHDFNNLLTAILGSLDLALRRVPEEPQIKRLLNNAKMAAERGASLTQRLLSFSRRREANARTLDVNAIIRDMGDLLTRTLGGVEVEQNLAPDLWPITVDPDQIELAVLNLCINARDAMPEGGVVTVSTRRERVERDFPDLPAGDYAVIAVHDTGTGIPPEILSRVFEPFFTTKEVGKGTGLGLSMVYGLAQQFGGAVLIHSAPGAGTTVEMLFPPSQERAEALPKSAQPVAAETAARLRILVVDDDRSVRDVTAAYLGELGHEAVESDTGADALERLREDASIQVLIADLAMPGMNGIELAQSARGARPDLPVLLTTGFAEKAPIPAGMAVLHKPFQRAELAARLQDIAASLTG